MVRTKEVMLVFLLGIIFLSACSTQKNTSGVTGAYANCNGDETQMVTATFADFAPVSSETNPYQAGDDIDVEVVLTNKFSDDIDTGKARVRLTGDAAITSIFSGAQEKNAEKLFGIDSETCLEETTEVDVGPIVYQGEITTKVNKEITGLYCYEEPVVVKAYLYYTARGEANGEMRFKIYLENVGTGIIVPSLNECFEYRDAGYREEFTIDVKGAYDIDCPDDVKLSRGDKTDVITCLVTGVDSTNLGAQASEISITLSGFAYEDVIPSTTIWLEP